MKQQMKKSRMLLAVCAAALLASCSDDVSESLSWEIGEGTTLDYPEDYFAGGRLGTTSNNSSVALLSAGIFVGAVWANISWGSYWSWDPKETWALITLMVYSVPLHGLPRTDSPRAYHIYIFLALLTVLMTYFGVNYFLSGMHAYS